MWYATSKCYVQPAFSTTTAPTIVNQLGQLLQGTQTHFHDLIDPAPSEADDRTEAEGMPGFFDEYLPLAQQDAEEESPHTGT